MLLETLFSIYLHNKLNLILCHTYVLALGSGAILDRENVPVNTQKEKEIRYSAGWGR